MAKLVSKGAFIIAGYTLVLALHFLASLMGWKSMHRTLLFPGIPLATLSAVYTAYLFAQAKARDMWQNPLLPPHLFVQALLLGSALLLPLSLYTNAMRVRLPPIDQPLMWLFAVSSLLHLLMIWGEVSLTDPTAHARLAIWEMVSGRYKSDFWMGTAMSTIGGLLPRLALLDVVSQTLGVAGAPIAMIGLMLYENAYVQAGQSVPLA